MTLTARSEVPRKGNSTFCSVTFSFNGVFGGITRVMRDSSLKWVALLRIPMNQDAIKESRFNETPPAPAYFWAVGLDIDLNR